MKYTAIFTLLALLGVFLCFYVLQNLQLLDWEKIQPMLDERKITTQAETVRFVTDFYRRGQILEFVRMQVVFAFITGVALLVGGSLGAIHLLVDKLLFKKFYEPPNLALASRRAAFWATLPYLIGLGGLSNYLNGGIILIIIVVYVLLEVLLSSIKIEVPQLAKFIKRKQKKK